MKLLSKPTVQNSTVAFVLAGMAVTTIHEVSHLTAALLMNLHPNAIFPNFVIPPDSITDHQAVIMAGTGPLFSLISGLLLVWWLKNWLTGPAKSFTKLFAIWFAFLSCETGFGYFLIAPLVSGGDTGQVLALTHAAWYVYLIVCAIGAAGVYLLLPRLFSNRMSLFAHDKKSFFELGMHPLWLGTIALVAIYALVDVAIIAEKTDPTSSFGIIFGLIGIATIGIFATLADYNAKLPAANTQKLKLATPKVGLLLVAIGALGLIFGLSHGLVVG